MFYVLVGKDRLEKTEAAYDRLCEVANRGRRATLLSWSAFRDDGTIWQPPNTFENPAAYLANERASIKYYYRRDRLAGPSQRIEVWCEASGMVPQLASVCEPFGVAIGSSGGFDSTTAKYEHARRLADESRPTVILHVGDHDHSGVSVFDALAEDVRAFMRVRCGPEPEFVRLAVTPEQVARLGLSTAPPKKNDTRGGFVGQTTQAEAIAPDELARIVRDTIATRLDLPRLERVIKAEANDRRQLLAALKRAIP